MSLTGTLLIRKSLTIERGTEANTKVYCTSDALEGVKRKIP